MTSGKEKGSEFERVVCKQLSKWMGHDKPIMWRADNTPGQRGSKGDLVAIHGDAQWFIDYFNVECKFYKDFRLGHILTGQYDNIDGILGWWRQCKTDAATTKRRPFLVFKRNRFPTLLAVAPDPWIDDILGPTLQPVLAYRLSNVTIFTIMLFEQWLDFADAEGLKQFLSDEQLKQRTTNG